MKLRSGQSTSGMDLAEDGENGDSAASAESNMHTVTIAGRTFNKVVMMTHFNIFLYAACFWIQAGVLPYLTKALGVDTVVFGYLQTTFAIVQLCGGPVYGRFGDQFGSRAALVMAFAAAATSYGLLGLAGSVWVLFLSRLPSMFMHAMQGGQMVVTDMSPPGQRVDALGKLGLSYGVGMVIGPVVGGLLTKMFTLQFSAFAACAGSIISVFIVLTFTPKKTKKIEHKDPSSATSIFSLKKIGTLLRSPGAGLLLFVKLISGVPIGIFQSMFVVVAMDTFKLAPDQNGYIMSYIGVITMIVQGVGIGVLSKRFSEMNLIRWGAFVLIWAYLLLAYVGTVWQLCLVLIPLCLGLVIMSVVISSSLTHCVDVTDTGAILGLNMAVNSLIRTVSPTIGGIMLNRLGFSSFGYLGFVNSLFIFIFLSITQK